MNLLHIFINLLFFNLIHLLLFFILFLTSNLPIFYLIFLIKIKNLTKYFFPSFLLYKLRNVMSKSK